MAKEQLLDNLRKARKKYGNDSPKTYRAIFALVREYPYYDGYIEQWLRSNEYKFR